mgnify:CR=1 FL=1|tara:strand:+ start:132 stop:467 length:336 start_codon:yes stop_codon:yes gene_type:complete
MKRSKSKLYLQLILDEHTARLETFPSGDAEAIATILAKAICYAEAYTNVEITSEEIGILISELVRRIENPLSTEFHIKGNVYIHVSNVAYQRYQNDAPVIWGGTSDPTHLW